MDQGSYRNERKQESISNQGRYGENDAPMELVSWTCPNCETINTEEVCVVCGYSQMKRTANLNALKRVGIGIVAAIFVCGVVLFAGASNRRKYNNACNLLSQQQFEEAISLFAELGDYKDSSMKQTEAIYAWAETLLAEYKFDDALDKLGQIPDYEKTYDLILETHYQKAMNLYQKAMKLYYRSCGNFKLAYLEFDQVPGYKDSDEQKSKLVVDWAERILTDLNNDSMQDARLFARTIGVIPEDRSREIYELIISIDHYDTNPSNNALGGGYHPVDFSVRKLLLEQLTGNIPHKDELSRLFDAFSDEDLGLNNQILDNSDLIRALWEDIPVVKNVVEGYGNIEGWLWGKWESSTNEYIQFQGQKTKYNLPADTKPQHATLCSISWMEFYWQDEYNNRLQNPFRISLISPDTIEVYCYKNGETYTLHRSK